MVNTEPNGVFAVSEVYYNILNIVVNTEQLAHRYQVLYDYNILNIVVNTEQDYFTSALPFHYNILNIVVNTEQQKRFS